MLWFFLHCQTDKQKVVKVCTGLLLCVLSNCIFTRHWKSQDCLKKVYVKYHALINIKCTAEWRAAYIVEWFTYYIMIGPGISVLAKPSSKACVHLFLHIQIPSNRLHESHITQYHWGHCKAEYHWGYCECTVTGATVHSEATDYSHSTLSGTCNS